jgi:hypothetical protein
MVVNKPLNQPFVMFDKLEIRSVTGNFHQFQSLGRDERNIAKFAINPYASMNHIALIFALA